MGNPNIKVITIEANSREEAMAQLKEQLGADVPSEVLDFIAEKARENGAKNGQAAGAGQSKPTKPTKGEMVDFAKKLAGTPSQYRSKVLEEFVVDLGSKFGIPREEALARAAEVKAKVEGASEALGINLPRESQVDPDNVLGSTKRKVPDMLTALRELLEGKPTPEPTNKLTDEEKSNFDKTYALLEARGVTEQQLCHIGQFYNHQDELVGSMQYLYHLADGHGHRPSAVLFKQIDDYLNETNKWLYDTCEKAGADPTHFGFCTREGYAENNGALGRIREKVAKVLDSKSANSFA